MAWRSTGMSERKAGAAPAGSKPPGGLLIWLSGADPLILAKAPREARKFTGVGGVVLTTAVMAAVSASFALHVGVRAPLWLSAIIGLGWGLAIMNLDRWLVTAAQRRDRWYQNLTVALPRLCLALIIGTVISTPLVLWIFQKEINTELDVIHQQKVEANATTLNNDPRFAGLPKLRDEIDSLQKVVDGTTPTASVADDPTVKSLQTQYDNLQTQYLNAERDAACELDGSCGSHSRGVGPAYQQKLQFANELKAQRDAVGAQLDQAKRDAATRLAGVQGNEVDSAKTRLAADRAQYDQLTAQKKAESDTFARNNQEDRGLLAQLDALSRFTGENSTLRTAYLALLLFITAIEVLPVLAKFLMNLGPPSLYDQILARAETSDIDSAEATLGYERALNAHELEARGKREQEAVTGLVDRMVQVETEVYDRMIDEWRSDQLGRTSGQAARRGSRAGGLFGAVRRRPGGRPGAGRPRTNAQGYWEWPAPEEE
jgi:Domain of unknown function (DUF4407)